VNKFSAVRGVNENGGHFVELAEEELGGAGVGSGILGIRTSSERPRLIIGAREDLEDCRATILTQGGNEGGSLRGLGRQKGQNLRREGN